MGSSTSWTASQMAGHRAATPRVGYPLCTSSCGRVTRKWGRALPGGPDRERHRIRFVDLDTQKAKLRPEFDATVVEAFDHNDVVLGRSVSDFEQSFAAYCGTGSAFGVNSGTSALHQALVSDHVLLGDEVIMTTTLLAAGAAISYAGAKPVLVGISPASLTIDAEQIEAAITPRTRAIVPVHRYGQSADMDPILDIVRRHGLMVIEDACKAHGAQYHGRRLGSLGASGEGGMVVTSHPARGRKVALLRNWGQTNGYEPGLQGYNCRMDGIKVPY
jgi:dTDP-4-amino-4,6-dideoxygalactose transaminase